MVSSPVDQITLDYLKVFAPERYERGDYTVFSADEDASYIRTIEIDLASVPLTVAFPHLPENAKAIGTFGRVDIDQVVIGSCTNGRMEDMRLAADYLKGRKVSKGLRLIVIPGSQRVYRECLREGLIEIFVDAGAVVSAPTCGPCLGGHMGILAAGERCVATNQQKLRWQNGPSEIRGLSCGCTCGLCFCGKRLCSRSG